MNRRNFLKNTGIVLAGSFLVPELAYSELINNPKILRKRNDLYRLSDKELFSRMIFGEARDSCYEERVWIAHTPLNRVNDGKTYNGEGSLKDVLLKREIKGNGKVIDQYNCFSDFKDRPRIYKNFLRTLNPEYYEPLAWAENKILAENIMEGSSREYNFGQTTYVEKGTLELWRKNDNTPRWIKNSVPIKTPEHFSHQFFM